MNSSNTKVALLRRAGSLMAGMGRIRPMNPGGGQHFEKPDFYAQLISARSAANERLGRYDLSCGLGNNWAEWGRSLMASDNCRLSEVSSGSLPIQPVRPQIRSDFPCSADLSDARQDLDYARRRPAGHHFKTLMVRVASALSRASNE